MRSKIAFLITLMAPALLYATEQDGVQKQKTTPAHTVEASNTAQFPEVVLPEATTAIRLSSSDINRIACTGDIREVLTSTEKGITIKITGKDAFVKFKVIKKGDRFSYASTPTELYVVCGDKVFSMIAFPQRIPSQTIRLSSGKENKIRENLSLYGGMPFEKKILKVIKEVFTENIPDSYSINRQDKRFYTFKEILLTLKRTIDIEGEGLRIKEYEVALRNETSDFKMNEKMFLKTSLVENPVAITLERHVLRKGDSSRVLVVEQRAERQPPRNLAGDLPVMDQSNQDSSVVKQGHQKAPSLNHIGSESQEAADEK